MKRIKILFPQITIDSKEVEVTEEQFDSLVLNRNGVEEFVWENMTDQEQSWTLGEKFVNGFIENCNCGVFDPEELKNQTHEIHE